MPWSRTHTGNRRPSRTKQWQIAEREQRNWGPRTSRRSSPRNSASPSDLVRIHLSEAFSEAVLTFFRIWLVHFGNFVLTTVTLCRWASNFQLKVQTSGRLSHRPVLLDRPVLLHEGRSGERQEPGNKSNAGDVKDHLWLQDRWGFSLWDVWSHLTLCFFLGQRN